jgi:NitT/TauT family transport system ATP-binding protein
MVNNQLLSTKGLCFSYGAEPILEKIELHVDAAERVALIGPSGHGKTTLLQLLAGTLRPTRGEVTKRGLWRRVFQNTALFPWLTVEENIRMGLRGVDVSQALPFEDLFRLFDLGRVRDRYPRQLSGGLRQRVEFARALIGRPDGLLLDEPFSSLDYILRREMCDYLQEFVSRYPTAMVLVTHDIPEAVLLTDRSCLLGHRPATFLKTYDHSATPAVQTTENILQDLRESVKKESVRSEAFDHEK